MSAPRERVTVVDDHSLFAESMVIALTGQGYDARCVVPDADARPAQLEREVVQTRPDLVLLDLDLGIACDGMRLAGVLTAMGVRVVVVTGSADRTRRGEALSQGACAVVSKSAPLTEIFETVARVSNGLLAMPREERAELLAAWRSAEAVERDLRVRFEQLTTREAEVLAQLMAGRQVSEIARIRFVSESTVRTQVKSVLAKLQVSSQLTAVGLAHQVRWRPPVVDGGEPAVPAATPATPRGRTNPGWRQAG